MKYIQSFDASQSFDHVVETRVMIHEHKMVKVIAVLRSVGHLKRSVVRALYGILIWDHLL